MTTCLIYCCVILLPLFISLISGQNNYGTPQTAFKANQNGVEAQDLKNARIHTIDPQVLKTVFHEGKIVPDVIAMSPKGLLEITYPGFDPVIPGSTLMLEEVKETPSVKWSNVDKNALYTLYFVNPDVPSRNIPMEAEWQHWTIHNIPGGNVDQGETIVAYSPEYTHDNSSGIKRIVALVYKQDEKIDTSDLEIFDSNTFRKSPDDTRGDLHVRTVSNEYGLGSPVAGNYFYLDAFHDRSNLDQGGVNTACNTSSDCKQQFNCIQNQCTLFGAGKSLEKPKKIKGTFEIPNDCQADSCQVKIHWESTNDGILQINTTSDQDVSIGFSDTADLKNGTGYTLLKNGSITEGVVKNGKITKRKSKKEPIQFQTGIDNSKRWFSLMTNVTSDKFDFASNSFFVFVQRGKYVYYKEILPLEEPKKEKKYMKHYKYPQNCTFLNCDYWLKMVEVDDNVVEFHLLFRGSKQIQIGLTDVMNQYENADAIRIDSSGNITDAHLNGHNIVEDDHNDVYDLQIVRNDSEVHEVKFKRKIDTNDPEDKILKEVVEIYILTDEELAAEENEVIRQTELPQATTESPKKITWRPRRRRDSIEIEAIMDRDNKYGQIGLTAADDAVNANILTFFPNGSVFEELLGVGLLKEARAKRMHDAAVEQIGDNKVKLTFKIKIEDASAYIITKTDSQEFWKVSNHKLSDPQKLPDNSHQSSYFKDKLSGQFKYPRKCLGNECSYEVKWSPGENGKEEFYIFAKNSSHLQIGLSKDNSQLSDGDDIISIFKNGSVIDGYLENNEVKPDLVQNIENEQFDDNSGLNLKASFRRDISTNDEDHDIDLDKLSSVYILGGSKSNGDINPLKLGEVEQINQYEVGNSTNSSVYYETIEEHTDEIVINKYLDDSDTKQSKESKQFLENGDIISYGRGYNQDGLISVTTEIGNDISSKRKEYNISTLDESENIDEYDKQTIDENQTFFEEANDETNIDEENQIVVNDEVGDPKNLYGDESESTTIEISINDDGDSKGMKKDIEFERNDELKNELSDTNEQEDISSKTELDDQVEDIQFSNKSSTHQDDTKEINESEHNQNDALHESTDNTDDESSYGSVYSDKKIKQINYDDKVLPFEPGEDDTINVNTETSGFDVERNDQLINELTDTYDKDEQDDAYSRTELDDVYEDVQSSNKSSTHQANKGNHEPENRDDGKQHDSSDNGSTYGDKNDNFYDEDGKSSQRNMIDEGEEGQDLPFQPGEDDSISVNTEVSGNDMGRNDQLINELTETYDKDEQEDAYSRTELDDVYEDVQTSNKSSAPQNDSMSGNESESNIDDTRHDSSDSFNDESSNGTSKNDKSTKGNTKKHQKDNDSNTLHNEETLNNDDGSLYTRDQVEATEDDSISLNTEYSTLEVDRNDELNNDLTEIHYKDEQDDIYSKAELDDQDKNVQYSNESSTSKDDQYDEESLDSYDDLQHDSSDKLDVQSGNDNANNGKKVKDNHKKSQMKNDTNSHDSENQETLDEDEIDSSDNLYAKTSHPYATTDTSVYDDSEMYGDNEKESLTNEEGDDHGTTDLSTEPNQEEEFESQSITDNYGKYLEDNEKTGQSATEEIKNVSEDEEDFESQVESRKDKSWEDGNIAEKNTQENLENIDHQKQLSENGKISETVSTTHDPTKLYASSNKDFETESYGNGEQQLDSSVGRNEESYGKKTSKEKEEAKYDTSSQNYYAELLEQHKKNHPEIFQDLDTFLDEHEEFKDGYVKLPVEFVEKAKYKELYCGDELGKISSKPSHELNCKAKKGSTRKWTVNEKFNHYQECSSFGKRLIRKCPPNSVFWNVLQCCVHISDYPCFSNCIQPIQKCTE